MRNAGDFRSWPSLRKRWLSADRSSGHSQFESEVSPDEALTPVVRLHRSCPPHFDRASHAARNAFLASSRLPPIWGSSASAVRREPDHGPRLP
jgi:hypothetical protein